MKISTTTYAPPLSGPVIGAVVGALRLQNSVLNGRTARRYFSGDRIAEQNRHDVFEALGKSLVEQGFIPRIPFLEREGIPIARVISTGIAWYADQWDQLVGYMRSISAPVDRPELAAVSYLRLGMIDLALRASAVLWLADLPTPREETPLWAKNRGGAMYLRQLLDRCGAAGPTRDCLAERLEVSYNTVDNWLDTDTQPSRSNIDRIAEELTPHIPDLGVEQLKSQLHLHYALCALCDLLATHIGREDVINLATALVRFTSRNLAGLRQFSKLEPDDGARRQVLILTLGVRFVSSEYLLRALWRQERDRVWKTDLMAASKPWYLRVTHIAQHLGGIKKAIQLLSDEYAIPAEKAEQLIEETLREIQADVTRPATTDPSELEGRTIVRVKGDAKYSARNRIIQYTQARSEGDLETALMHIRRAVELQPESAEYHFQLGGTLGMMGKVEEGIQECWIAVGLDPSWELPRVEVGIILLNAGRNKEARDHLERVESSQDNPTPHLAFNLGVARARSGDPAGALDKLEAVIKAKPDHALALDQAAHCAFLIGNKVKGRRLAKRAHQFGQSETYREWRQGKYRTTNTARETL